MGEKFEPIPNLDQTMLDYTSLNEYQQNVLPVIPKTMEEMRELINKENYSVNASVLSNDSVVTIDNTSKLYPKTYIYKPREFCEA